MQDITTFTEGQTVTINAGPGYPTDARLTVIEATPRRIVAAHLYSVEVFTLRKNGKFAQKGEPMWSNYLKAVR